MLIDRIIREKRLVKKEIAEKVGITSAYLSNISHKETLDAALLEKLCKAIGVSPSIFFDCDGEPFIGEVNNTAILGNANVQITKGEVEALKKVIEAQEQTINLLLAQLSSGQKRDITH